MAAHIDPALAAWLQVVGDDQLLVRIHPHLVVQSDAYPDYFTGQVVWNAVAVAAHVDVTIPTHPPVFHIRRSGTSGGQTQGRRLLTRKTFTDDFFEGAMHALVGFLPQPLLGQGVQMRHAVKGAIAYKEMPLDVAYHPLIFALGLGPVGLAGARCKAIMAGKVYEAGVEHRPLPNHVRQYCAFLVV